MSRYTLHTPETAVTPAGEMLAGLQQTIGFVPNVFAVMGGTPHVLAAFIEVTKRFGQTTFTSTEREIVHIATSVENRCNYCVAGHTAFAHMQKVPQDVIDAVRDESVLADPKLAALHDFVRDMVVNRGHPTAETLERFLAVGYTANQIQEVILGICEKIFSNFISVSLELPLDDEFKPYIWSSITSREAA